MGTWGWHYPPVAVPQDPRAISRLFFLRAGTSRPRAPGRPRLPEPRTGAYHRTVRRSSTGLPSHRLAAVERGRLERQDGRSGCILERFELLLLTAAGWPSGWLHLGVGPSRSESRVPIHHGTALRREEPEGIHREGRADSRQDGGRRAGPSVAVDAATLRDSPVSRKGIRRPGPGILKRFPSTMVQTVRST